MKIDKLYTLSQFVELIDESKSLLFKGNAEAKYGFTFKDLFLKVKLYNDFLKQPLKKEMFVNELKEPIGYIGFGSEKAKDKVAWKKAEKKVIFEDAKINWSEDEVIAFEVQGVEVGFWTQEDKWDATENETEIHSLHDLSEATNGELKLKNVEL